MLFPAVHHDGIADGSITLAFRSWTRPTVRAGGTLITAVGQLAIEAVDVVQPSAVSAADARRAGYEGVDELRRWLRTGDPGRALYRIEFHLIGEDPRIALRRDVGDDATRAAVVTRLARMDARSASGPWTGEVLRLIAEKPATRSADLAAELGVEQQELKVRIRRLKAMGLTDSLGTGYRLSPRGEAVLRLLR